MNVVAQVLVMLKIVYRPWFKTFNEQNIFSKYMI